MIDNLIKKFALKYALKLVNDAINKKVDVDTAVALMKRITAFLNNLSTKLEDGKITQEEGEEMLEELKKLF